MKKTYFILIFFLACLVILSISIGRYYIPAGAVIKILASKFMDIPHDWPVQMETIIFKIRIPRIIGAIFTGGGLALSASVLQSMFRNPLVSPFMLGVSSGAGFGACIAILLELKGFYMQLCVFCGGIIAVMLTYLFGKNEQESQISLVLSGIIVGGFFTSLISALKYAADPYTKLPEIVFWLMGSLANVSGDALWPVAALILCSGAFLYLYSWKFNILSLGEIEAGMLGEDIKKLKLAGIVLTTLVSASTVLIAGVIGWVGLVIANVARIIAGPDLARLIPLSALTGAIYLLAIDDIARNISNVEIPLGILTSLIGAPFFIYILKKQKMIR